MSVTRVEIADHVETVFTGAPVTRVELLDAAKASGARRKVLKLLQDLPDRPFLEMRQLWPQMPDMPVEH